MGGVEGHEDIHRTIHRCGHGVAFAVTPAECGCVTEAFSPFDRQQERATPRNRAAAAPYSGTGRPEPVMPPAEELTVPRRVPVSEMVRKVRRLAGLSQRELAGATGLASATVSRLESGRRTPTVALFERILRVAGLRLVVVDAEGPAVLPMRLWDGTTDGAGRRYPAHLDLILDPDGEWWGDVYGLTQPPETFHRDPERRAAQRRRSQWEVRVARHRHEPAPPDRWRGRPFWDRYGKWPA